MYTKLFYNVHKRMWLHVLYLMVQWHVQDAMEVVSGSAVWARRVGQPINSAEPTKAASLSKPVKANAPKAASQTKSAKSDTAKPAGVSKPGKLVVKVGTSTRSDATKKR